MPLQRSTTGKTPASIARLPLVGAALSLALALGLPLLLASHTTFGGSGSARATELYLVSLAIELVAEHKMLVLLPRAIATVPASNKRDESKYKWDGPRIQRALALVDASALVARALVLACLLLFATPEPSSILDNGSGGAKLDASATRAYSLSVVTYALTLAAGYFALERVSRPTTTVAVKRAQEETERRTMASVAKALVLQSFVKQLATASDRLALTYLVLFSSSPSPGTDDSVDSASASLGAYALARNYGALIARVVLEPTEHSLRLYFSSAHASNDDAALSTTLTMALRVSTHAALVLALFTPHYVATLLDSFVLTEQWRHDAPSAASVVSLYVALYTPLLAFNGIAEGFVACAASANDLAKTQTPVLALSSVVFAAALALAPGVRHLAPGLLAPDGREIVTCSTLAIAVRSLYALTIARKRLATRFSLAQALRPRLGTVLTTLLVAELMRRSAALLTLQPTCRELAMHVARGAGAGIAWLAVVGWSERKLLRPARHKID